VTRKIFFCEDIILRRHVILIVLVLFLVGFLVGWGNASREVGQIKLGMSKAEVVAILGEPREKETVAQGELLRWRFEGQEVLLVLNQDKVAGKQVTGRKVR
jgi:hypothetical protein